MSGVKDKHLLCLTVLSSASTRSLETARGSIVRATVEPLKNAVGVRVRGTTMDCYLVESDTKGTCLDSYTALAPFHLSRLLTDALFFRFEKKERKEEKNKDSDSDAPPPFPVP